MIIVQRSYNPHLKVIVEAEKGHPSTYTIIYFYGLKAI